MYYSQTSQKEIALAEGTCPLCGNKTKLNFFKHKRFTLIYIIPWWSTKNYVTCGTCFQTFEVKKELMQEVELALAQNKPAINEYCPNCRGLLGNSQNFCVNCGYKLNRVYYK